ncbi:hypothetical protein LXA43DRAFT_1003064 [Ganoderma leucocontextum]|nr:hypothetical protein LXA43DRAFT_1003064 [Ganoderma leucocontextum]
MNTKEELDERIYTHHVELMLEQAMASKSAGASWPTPSYVTYLWPSKSGASVARTVYPGYTSATLLESRTTIEAGTTGLRTWSASLVLGQHLLSRPELVAGKRVLELGCGVGFLGIIIGSIQTSENSLYPSSLWLTDVNEPVLHRCELNLRLLCNKSYKHPDLNVELVDWSDAIDPGRLPPLRAFFRKARPDVILGADLSYDPSTIPMLVNVLSVGMEVEDGGPGPTAYLALAVRNEETQTEFLRQAAELLEVEEANTVLVSENVFTRCAELGQDASSQTVRVVKFRRKL